MLRLTISLLLIFSSSLLTANTVTIDFDDFDPVTGSFAIEGGQIVRDGFQGGVEDGFTISVANSVLSVDTKFDLGSFSGQNSLHHYAPERSVITITNGGLFRLTNFQLGFQDFNDGTSPEEIYDLIVTGLLKGQIIGVNSYTPVDGAYTQGSPLSLSEMNIDTLIFDMGDADIGPLHLDNIVLETIPVPATIWFFCSGMILLVRMRKKHSF